MKSARVSKRSFFMYHALLKIISAAATARFMPALQSRNKK